MSQPELASESKLENAWQHGAYIAIEGPIGVGKSSLARRLGELANANLVLEAPEQNDFLPDFYRNQRRYALHTQLHFLIKRSRQLDELSEGRLFDRCTIADFSREKNDLFAQITLNQAEYKLYCQLRDLLGRNQLRPDLIIYLQAPVDVLIDRIAARGLRYELNIDSDYLRRICDAYVEFFHNYVGGPLLIVNAENINFIESDKALHDLSDKINSIRFGRNFYNPLPEHESLAFS